MKKYVARKIKFYYFIKKGFTNEICWNLGLEMAQFVYVLGVSINTGKAVLCSQKGQDGSYQPTPDSCFLAPRQPGARPLVRRQPPS